MNRENLQYVLLAVIVVGLMGLGAIILNQGVQLNQVSRAVITAISKIEVISERQSKMDQKIATPQSASLILMSTSTAQSIDQIKFPVVAYARPGFLNNTETGRAEKKQLEEKFINPYADFYNENGVVLVAIYLEVPTNVGEAYGVTGIFCGLDNICGGTEQFFFGKREQEYGYWQPPCDMDGCRFSDTFKKKHPQIKE